MRAALALALALAVTPLAAAQTAAAPPRTLTTGTPAATAPPAATTPATPPAATAPVPTPAAKPAPEAPQAASGEAVRISVDTSKGFARITFLWSKPVTFDASIADGVLVVNFARPLKITQGNLPLDNYVSVVRQDANGKTLRMQLKQKLRLHQSAAGPLIALDLLPPSFKSDPDDIADPTVKPVAKGPVDVKLTIAVKEDRTRLSFEWGEKVEYEAKVEDGTISAVFHRGGAVDVARLNKNPPGWVKSAKSTGGDNQVLLEIKIDPGSLVEHFRDKTAIVFDIKTPTGDAGAQPDEPAIVAPEEIAAEAKPGEGEPATEPKPEETEEPPLRPGSDGAAVAAAEPVPEEAEPEAKPEDRKPEEEGNPEAAPPEGEAAAVAAEPSRPTGPPAFKVERTRDEIDLTLPALADQATAMFRSGTRITILFEGTGAIDVEAVLKTNKDIVKAAEVHTANGITTLALELMKPFVVTALQRDGAWIAVVSPDPLEPPQAVALLRDARTVGPARVRATLTGAHRIVETSDPDSGERLSVVLAAGVPQGIIGARSYIDFAADSTAQGLVIRPFTDDLTVTTGERDVIIASPNGLTLAAGGVADYAPASESLGDKAHPAAMDFAAWTGSGSFLEERSRLLGAIKPDGNGGAGVENGRLALARFYVSYELGQEAIGTLQLVAMDDEKVVGDATFRALRGAALLVAGRPNEAAIDLASASLNDDPNAQLFRGLADAGLKKWSAARDAIVEGEAAIGDFRTDWQARFRVAGAEAALSTNAFDVADRMLNAMPKDGVPAAMLIHANLIRGEVAERLKQDGEALRLYGEVKKTGYRPLAVRAAFAEILLKQKTGGLSAGDAIKALEALRWQWRGDDVELGMLHELGRLQIAEGDYRNGLQTMRAAVLGFPEEEETHRIAGEMNLVFEDLFLNGKADALPAIQALGLYYDFKELTPIGAMGDDMVRRLADRLIAVDLLEQAAELLAHQVDKRLDGIAKSQIAAKLAAVYLMDRKPERALAVLRASSQTRLPEDLAGQRRLLTGRALSDLKQYDAALEAFEQDDGAEARRLRADVLWSAAKWPDAAAAIEVLIAGREKEQRPLDATDRYDILRAAVAYTMADDDTGLANLRQRFVALIADAPEAAAFEMVTRQIDPSAVAFRDMAKAVAAIDTLDAFLRSIGLGKPADGSAAAQ